jgi:DNA-binding transcriptional MerR regulator
MMLDEARDMVYTVKQLSALAGVSARTLHYYDEIGLLTPMAYGQNGYRYYGEEAVLRLQQILFYKELDFSLTDIRAILDRPDFDVERALHKHKAALQKRVGRLQHLIVTVDRTLLHLKGETQMSEQSLFEGFTPEQEEQYTAEARQLWGADRVNASVNLWKSYSPQKKAQIQAEAGAIYRDIAAHMSDGADSPAVQAGLARWHQNLRYFYEPTTDVLRGLGEAYATHPGFIATFRKVHPDLPEFLRRAITVYCQDKA